METDKYLMKVVCRALLFFFILMIIAPVTDAQSPNESLEDNKVKEEMKGEVLDHVRLLRAAILERDSVMLFNLLADEVIYVHSNGLKQNRGDVIGSIMSGQHDYKSISVLNAEIRLLGETAVVDLETDVAMLLYGRSLEMQLNILMVWVKNRSGWKLIARQSVKRNPSP